MTRQTEIPGCEDPQRDPAIDEQIDAWQKAKGEQREAADVTRIRHAKLLELLAERGLQRYAYLDPATGRKRYVVVESEPKAKLGKPIAPAKRDAADSVEHRKVSRAEAERDLGRKLTVAHAGETAEVLPPVDPDPFAATRAALEIR